MHLLSAGLQTNHGLHEPNCLQTALTSPDSQQSPHVLLPCTLPRTDRMPSQPFTSWLAIQYTIDMFPSCSQRDREADKTPLPPLQLLCYFRSGFPAGSSPAMCLTCR